MSIHSAPTKNHNYECAQRQYRKKHCGSFLFKKSKNQIQFTTTIFGKHQKGQTGTGFSNIKSHIQKNNGKRINHFFL